MADPDAALTASPQVDIEHSLDGVNITVATPGLRRAMLLLGTVALGAVGSGCMGLITSSPLTIWALLLVLLGAPLALMLTLMLRPWLYEVTIRGSQLTLRAGNLGTTTLPLSDVVDCEVQGLELVLFYQADGNAKARSWRAVEGVPLEAIAAVINDATGHAPDAGTRQDVPDTLVRMRRPESARVE